MPDETPLPEEHIARLIAVLPPVPTATVAAASEIPVIVRALEHADVAAIDRAALHAALERAGLEPTAARMAAAERSVSA